jgi:hypothetical protein
MVMVNGPAVGNIHCILIIVMCFIKVRRAVLADFDHDSHLLERVLEFVEESLAPHAFASHLEQEAQACMARVRVSAMFANNFVICFEERPEWEAIRFGFCLSSSDNLVEKADIYRGQAPFTLMSD